MADISYFLIIVCASLLSVTIKEHKLEGLVGVALGQVHVMAQLSWMGFVDVIDWYIQLNVPTISYLV